MNRINKSVVIMAIVLLASGAVISAYAEGGDSTDPLITLSYLEMRLEDISVPEGVGESVSVGATFDVVQVFDGETLTLGKSAEVILRSGKATAFVSERGGLADVTSGIDILKDETIPTNHLIISPLDDGRGFIFHSESWVMVKGDYRIN
jgi:hypothetical protein